MQEKGDELGMMLTGKTVDDKLIEMSEGHSSIEFVIVIIRIIEYCFFY